MVATVTAFIDIAFFIFIAYNLPKVVNKIHNTKKVFYKVMVCVEEILDGAALESVKEQFNGGCTVEIATFDRFTDFLSEETYEYIVFDTAPTGHTLRLMTLPGEWNDYIAKSEHIRLFFHFCFMVAWKYF